MCYTTGVPTPRALRTGVWGAGRCYENEADQVVFSVDQAVQLLGVGLCGTEGSFTAEVELSEVPEAPSCPALPCPA